MDDRFSKAAETWDEKPGRIKMAKKFVDEINKNVALNNKKIIDFGCGTGNVGLEFTGIASYINMIDTSEGMLEVLKNKIKQNNVKNVKVKHGDILTLNLNEKSYDAIISLMTFHHVKNIESVLKKFYSLLKNNGKVIIGDLVKEDGSFHQDDSPAHKGFNLMEIKSKIQDCGFQVDDIYVYNTIEKPDKNGQTREFEQFILTAHK